MDGGDKLHLGVLRELGLQHLRGERTSPLPAQRDNVGADPLGHVHHSLPKEAADAEDDRVIGFEKAVQPRLHPGGAGAGDCHGQALLCLEHPFQQLRYLVQYQHEVGVEIADHRGHHGLKHAGAGAARAGAEKDTGGYCRHL